MTTVAAANTSNQTSPSAELATTIRTGMAVAQTSYAINNGGGLKPGEPLRMIEDAALINAAGARALNVTIPDGGAQTAASRAVPADFVSAWKNSSLKQSLLPDILR